MFTEQLSKFPVRSRSPDFRISKQFHHSQDKDLHFEICTAFLKKTGQNLLLQEASIITHSSLILQTLKQSFKTPKRKTLYTSTDDSSQAAEDDYSLDSKQQLITRKNISRRSQKTVQQALKEVQEMCSPSVSAVMSSAVAELSKLQIRVQNMEAKQHLISKKQEAADKFHQENVLYNFLPILRLKKRLQAEQDKCKRLEDEIATLKEKSQSISKCVQEKMNAMTMNQKIVDINQKVYREIKAFLQDKEMHVNSRLRKIEHMQQAIMVKIQTILYEQNLGNGGVVNSDGSSLSVGESPCQRCCNLLKKMKQSILQYRDYLQHQAEQVQKLYSKHKKALFTTINNTKVGTSNKSLG